MGCRADAKVVIGRGQIQFGKKYVREVGIVMLPGVHQNLAMRKTKRGAQCAALDKLRPGANHADDIHGWGLSV
jgi:hypothetical protein